MELTDFLHASTISQLKCDLKFRGGHGQKLGDVTLKLTEFEEWTDGRNWFFAC